MSIAMIDPTAALIRVLNDATPDTIRVIQADRPDTIPLDEFSQFIGTIAIVPGTPNREATYPKGTLTFVARCYGIPNNDLEGYVSMDIARALDAAAYTAEGIRRGPRVAGSWYCDALTLGMPQGPILEDTSNQWVTLVNGVITLTLREVGDYPSGATIG